MQVLVGLYRLAQAKQLSPAGHSVVVLDNLSLSTFGKLE